MTKYRIKHIRIPPGEKEQNGRVERVQQTIKIKLNILVKENPEKSLQEALAEAVTLYK